MNVAEEIRKCNILLIQFEQFIKKKEKECNQFSELKVSDLINSFRIEFVLYKRKEILYGRQNSLENVKRNLKRLNNYLKSRKDIADFFSKSKKIDSNLDKNVIILGFNHIHLHEMSKTLIKVLNSDNEMRTVFLTRHISLINIDYSVFLVTDKKSEIVIKTKKLMPQITLFLNILFEEIRSTKELTKYKGVMMAIKELIIPKLKEVILFNLLAREFVNTSKVKVIVSMDTASWQDRTIIQYGNNLNLKTIGIQQGLASKEYPEFFDLQVNKICYAGNNAKEGLIYAEYPKINMEETGLINQSKIILENINKKKFIKDRFKVLVIGQYFNGDAFTNKRDKEALYMEVMKKFSRDEKFDVIYKPHPFESCNKLRIHSLFNKFQVLSKNISLENAVEMSDFVIVCSSTSIIEAIKKNKEIILLSDKKVLKHQHFSKSALGEGKNIQSLEDIDKIIEEIKFNRRKVNNKKIFIDFLNDFFGPVDGNNEKRIKKVIKDQLSI